MTYYIALVASIALNATSLILLKSYVVRGASGAISILDPRLLIAISLYAVAAAFWVGALLGVDLMVAYPTLASTYVVIGLVAPRLFDEEFSRHRWWGMGLIIAGVIVMHVL